MYSVFEPWYFLKILYIFRIMYIIAIGIPQVCPHFYLFNYFHMVIKPPDENKRNKYIGEILLRVLPSIIVLVIKRYFGL